MGFCLALPRAWITLYSSSCWEGISLCSPYKIRVCHTDHSDHRCLQKSQHGPVQGLHFLGLTGTPLHQNGVFRAHSPAEGGSLSRWGTAQSPLFPLLMILHSLVFSGLQEENRSCQEGVPEGPGCLPGQPRLQGTAMLTDGLNSQEPPGRSSFIRNAVEL